jgi:hypothetical protein
MQPLLQWKSNKYYILWEFIYRVRYPACSAPAPYCNMWPVRLSFSTLSHKGKILEENVIELIMCVSISSTTFDWNISHSKKDWARYDQSTHYSCQIVMKLEISIQIFEECSNISFMTIHPVGAELFHADRRTDRTQLMVDFLIFSDAPKNG